MRALICLALQTACIGLFMVHGQAGAAAVRPTGIRRGSPGNLALARVFSDHMVLQRGERVPVFGSDNPGQSVTVVFAGQSKTTEAGPEGHWRVDLAPMTASMAGRPLRVKGSSMLQVEDVVVGEVWLAAGQSNMDFPVARSATPPHPGNYHRIRMCNWTPTVDTRASTVYGAPEINRLTPENFYTGSWTAIDEDRVRGQSAVAYFFANALARELAGNGPGDSDVPIGVVEVAVGGTSTEAFIPASALQTDDDLRAAFADPRGVRTLGQWTSRRIARNLGGIKHVAPQLPHPHPYAPGFLFHAGIAQIAPFAFKGVIWYQGESNAEFTDPGYDWPGDRIADYQTKVMTKLVESWRDAFGKPELPFYMVQLPRINAPNRAKWPWYREAQSRVAGTLEGVEVAVAIEFGSKGANVHPPNKEPVGERLAYIARNRLYGEAVPYSGPVYQSREIIGNKIAIRFAHVGDGLFSRDGAPLRHFTISGTDGRFFPADAVIVDDRVEVSAQAVPAPIAVRYGWDMNPDVNLYAANDIEDLPAAPFRTDSFKQSRHLKLFILTGQSNALGTTNGGEADRSPGHDAADRHVMFFWHNVAGAGATIGSSEGTFTTLREQQGNVYPGSPTHWGPEFEFARTLYRAGVRDFGIIKACRGGGGNAFWLKGSDDDHMYRHIRETVAAATADLHLKEHTFEIAGLLYLQGESDNATEAAQAGVRLKLLTDNLRADLPNAANLHTVAAGTTATGNASDAASRKNQEAIAAATNYIDFFANGDIPDLLGPDGLHLGKVGKLVVGNRFAQAFLNAGVVSRDYGRLGIIEKPKPWVDLIKAGQQVALSDMQVQHVVTGWGRVGIDESVSGGPLSIGGRTFERGLGVHAESTIQVQLGGDASRFTATVGVDDVMAGKGSVDFVVRGDGRELWRSGIMRGGQDGKNVDVSLKGIRLMELNVEDGGDGIGQDHANWCDPVITFQGRKPRVVPPSRPLSPTNRGESKAALIPYPRHVTWREGSADVSRYQIAVHGDKGQKWSLLAQQAHGVLKLSGGTAVGTDGLPVVLRFDDSVEGEESYRLAVTAERVEIRASQSAGMFYGIQTLKQLAAADIAAVPLCTIRDYPAFGWRGFMHDLGRNPQDVDLLKRFIDVMAGYKLNIFHMHLTDYPGYRIECRKYPQLNEPKNYRQTRRPGFFYTYKQLNDIIQYCADRHILVVPEIDMPGHSEYFKKTFGVDMQDPKGMQILSEIVSEFCDHVNLPYFHMGSDEVHVRNKAFMPHMVKLLRDRGKDLLVWRPGHLPDPKVITQLWTGQSRPVTGVRYLDSRANYVNHLDALAGPVRIFTQQPCRVPEGTDLALGGILCHWPDNNVGEQINVYRQSPVMPALLTYAERIWRGALNNRRDCWAKLPSPDDSAFGEYAAFEADMIAHRDRLAGDWPFPYVKQTDICWKLIGPFDHKGDTEAGFPVEDGLEDVYTVDGKEYRWHDQISYGGTIHVNHFFGFPGHLQEDGPGTVYAMTGILSPKDQTVHFWVGFNENSRSGGRRCGPNPAQGQWTNVGAKVWINDAEILPPLWRQPGLSGSPEVPFVDENYFYRTPVKVHLKKGMNKVLVKAPHGKPAWKWMFTCVPVTWDGKLVGEMTGLTFTTEFIERSAAE